MMAFCRDSASFVSMCCRSLMEVTFLKESKVGASWEYFLMDEVLMTTDMAMSMPAMAISFDSCMGKLKLKDLKWWKMISGSLLLLTSKVRLVSDSRNLSIS
jgi:hypothetical protein